MPMPELVEIVISPPAPADYNAYYADLLTTAGVLFGLAFAALLFVIQSGFASFKFSRRMFLEIYVRFGRGLLVGLAYLTLLPFAMLHFPFYSAFFSGLYYLFAVLYAKAILDHARQLGYIHTLMSTAFVPGSFGPVRRYLRYISNMGCGTVLVWLSVLFVLLGYPVIISIAEGSLWTLTPKGFFYSSVLVLCHVALRITNFIPEFFELSVKELEVTPEPSASTLGNDTSVDYTLEKKALKKYLLDHSVQEVGGVSEIQFLDGGLRLDLLQDRAGAEVWFNVNITIGNATNVEVRDEVCHYAIQILELFSRSQVDINQIVMSFHIRFEGDVRSRNIFLRTTRSELESVLSHSDDPVQAVTSIKSRLFDELFRDL